MRHKKQKKSHVQVSGLTDQKRVQISKESAKQTRQRDDERSSPLQQIENTYEFYTRQRPLNFTPTILKQTQIFQNTSGFPNSEKRFLLKVIDQGQAMIVHSLRTSIRYFPEAFTQSLFTEVLNDDALDVLSFVTGVPPSTKPFYFNLISSSNSMYEAELADSFNPFAPLGGFAASAVGISTLNQNVLDFGGDGGTTLFVPENSQLSYVYSMTANPNSGGATPPVVPTTVPRQAMAITFEVKGHMMTMREYDVLKTLNQKTDILGLLN